MENKCPVCHRTMGASHQGKSEEAKYFPFCSRRCRLLDLGAWLDGSYRIEAGPVSQESDEPSQTFYDQSDIQQ